MVKPLQLETKQLNKLKTIIMKIAIPTKNNQVDDHFGHCDNFSIATIENKTLSSIESVPSPKGCGCKSNIIDTLKSKGVTIMLAGNIGQGAVNKINQANIKVVRGCCGNINDVITDYLNGNISDSAINCNHAHHTEGHQCNH